MFRDLIEELKASMGIYGRRDDGFFGLLAEFRDPAALYHAAEGMRRAGYRFYDTHSPFPIHGMNRAMGIGNSKVGFITLGGGLTGLLLGIWLQWWTGAVDYPINISGKPFFAWEPSIPVIFELTVLLSAFGAVTGMLLLNGLPRPYNPLFYSRRFARATDDGFFLHVASVDKRFDSSSTHDLLTELGALHVEEIFDTGDPDGVDQREVDGGPRL